MCLIYGSCVGSVFLHFWMVQLGHTNKTRLAIGNVALCYARQLSEINYSQIPALTSWKEDGIRKPLRVICLC